MSRTNQISIAGRKVGEGQPCFIIAEAGANFRISDDPKVNFQQALKMIGIAADAKADAVKFQLYRADKLYVRKAGQADYIGKKKSIYDIIREMELPYEWLPKLKKHCEDKGIIFLCSPFDEESADKLDEAGVAAFKVASYTITHFPLLRHIARKGKPIILSTGASNKDEVKDAIKAVEKEGNRDIIVLQCTAKYPAPMSSINLKVIQNLREDLGVIVGLSDHSREPLIAPLGAVALGAKVVEKHFTTDNSLPGPDHGFAILPEELKSMVTGIRQLEEAMGTGIKGVLDDEKELHTFARRFIFSARSIKKGEQFTTKNLAVLRPGKHKAGLPPSRWDDILGKKAKRDIRAQEPILEDCI